MRPHSARAGFTAIELMAVVAIMGVLALVAVPRVSSALIDAQLQSTVRLLAADAHHVRQLAIMRGATTRMDFLRLSGHPHQVRVFESRRVVVEEPPREAIEIVELTEYRRTLPAGISFMTPDENFAFTYLGEPTTFNNSTPNSTIWIQASNGRSMFLILSLGGRIRISTTPP